MGKSIRDKHKDEEPKWIKCIICGADAFAYATETEAKWFICKSCREASRLAKIKNVEEEHKTPLKNVVSMRCRRHKRRFNVEEEWLETDKWLCPQCHERLSAKERECYYPANTTIPDIKAAEAGKPTMSPKGKSRSRENAKDAKRVGAEKKVKSEEKGNGVKRGEEISSGQKRSLPKTDKSSLEAKAQSKEKRKHAKQNFKPITNPSLLALLPKYKIHCQKCGETVPCHYSWFEKSTVLCPSCYSKMPEAEIAIFHEGHKSPIPKLVSSSYPYKAESPNKSQQREESGLSKEKMERVAKLTGLMGEGEGWSQYRISTATLGELKMGVRNGRISAARARIEMRRRGNRDYYDMLIPADSL